MKKALKNKEKKLKLTTLGFTLIELLAVIVILAVIALIATPMIMGVIDEARKGALERTFDNIEHAAELYFFNKYEGKLEQDSMIIPMPELKDMVKNYNSDMEDESVVVSKKVDNINFYYTGRDNNPYKTIGKLKELIEADTNHIKMNVVVNGETVNKVYGTKSEKDTVMKNYVWYSGNLWQVLETSDNYIKMVLAHSITSISYGSTSDWNTSWVRKWLNDTGEEYSGIFYNGLDRQDIILNGNFCLNEVNVTTTLKTNNSYVVTVPTSSTKITSCSNKATDKVGLLTFEDYVYANTGNSAVYTGGSFLDEDELMWTMTKYTKNSTYPTTLVWTQWCDSFDGKTGYLNVDTGGTVDGVTKSSSFRTNVYGLDVRPVIYIKSDVNVRGGNGTKKDPFILSVNQEYTKDTALNQVTIGEYIYLDEGNAPEGNHANKIVNGYFITYDKNKVQYRIIDILDDGSIKVERADVLKDLDSSMAINYGETVPFYYKWDGSNTSNTCGCEKGIGSTCYWGGCTNNNIYNPSIGSGTYTYADGENLGYYLNNASNSYYNWLSDTTKGYIKSYNWNLPVSAHGNDYSDVYRYTVSENYPSRRNDGTVIAKVGLPSYGERYSSNDLNYNYWYINRWIDSSSFMGRVLNSGVADGMVAGDAWTTIRPVMVLNSNIVITSGNGTMSNPYSISD